MKSPRLTREERARFCEPPVKSHRAASCWCEPERKKPLISWSGIWRWIDHNWMLLAAIACVAALIFVVTACGSAGSAGDVPRPDPPPPPPPGSGKGITYSTSAQMSWFLIPAGVVGLGVSYFIPQLKHLAGSVLFGGIVCLILPWALDVIDPQITLGSWAVVVLGVCFIAYWLALKAMRMWKHRFNGAAA